VSHTNFSVGCRADRACPYPGACPHTRELNGTFCDGVPGDRKGRDGVNPSSTHLSTHNAQMCRRGACPLATLAVAVPGPHAHDIAKFAPIALSSFIWRNGKGFRPLSKPSCMRQMSFDRALWGLSPTLVPVRHEIALIETSCTGGAPLLMRLYLSEECRLVPDIRMRT
jgi:hypothetical protein